MRIAGKTDIGRGRDENQDTFRGGEVPGAGAFGIVCDGMGGAQNGRLASAVAADCIEEMLYRQLRDGEALRDPEQILRDAIQLANAEVFARSGGGVEMMMGTTVVCAIAREDMLYLAHVGDSRAYLWHEGKLRQLTHDHSMVQELVDMGSITPEEAATHPERNVITRALGVEESVEPSYTELPLGEGDRLLMCTDGLTGMVSAPKISDIMANTGFDALPTELVETALDAGGDDNITVLILSND